MEYSVDEQATRPFDPDSQAHLIERLQRRPVAQYAGHLLTTASHEQPDGADIVLGYN